MNISLKALFSKYKIPISLTFFLLTVEAILLALIPFGVGIAIDKLIENNINGISILLIILFLILVVSTGRRLYDTRVYGTIYALLGSKLIKNYKQNGIDKSKILTRSNLLKELVDFFEYDLTQSYTALIGLVTALVMVFYINSYVALVCIVSLIIIALIYKLSESHIYNENSNLNNELEKRLNLIEKKNIVIVNHFRAMKSSMIKLSDIESFNFIFIQILISIMILCSIIIAIESKLSVGQIFALVTYVINFSYEIIVLPVIFQQYIRLTEITDRINLNTKETK